MKRIAVLCMLVGVGNLLWTSTQERVPQEGRKELPPEVQEMRDEMFRGMPPDMRKLFEQAFDDAFWENGEIPEGFGGEGFPFDEIPGHLPDQFRRDEVMRELRDRPIDRNEKLSPRNLAAFAPVVAGYEKSILTLLREDGQQLAFGTCVDRDGLIVTKASEVAGIEELKASFGGKTFSAKVITVNERYDLALVHVPAKGLEPVIWAPSAPEVGTLIITSNENGEPLATGVVSVAARPLTDQGRAFLGVEPVTVDGGVLINSVTENRAAEHAGLQVGDVVTHLDGEATTTSHRFANDIRLKRPGDTVKLQIKRGSREIMVSVTLDGITINPSPFFNREMGAEMNVRMSDFDLAFQHDTPLWPEQCGGPLVDLEGRVVGFNIARSGRVRSYAIPSGKMRDLVEELVKAAKTTS